MKGSIMKKNNYVHSFCALAAIAMLMSSCTKTEKTVSGVALGAATGGVIGGVAGNGAGAAIGIGVGGTVGGLVGSSMHDDNDCRKKSCKECKRNNRGKKRVRKKYSKKDSSCTVASTQPVAAVADVSSNIQEGVVASSLEAQEDEKFMSEDLADVSTVAIPVAVADSTSGSSSSSDDSGEAEKLAQELEQAMAQANDIHAAADSDEIVSSDTLENVGSETAADE